MSCLTTEGKHLFTIFQKYINNYVYISFSGKLKNENGLKNETKPNQNSQVEKYWIDEVFCLILSFLHERQQNA